MYVIQMEKGKFYQRNKITGRERINYFTGKADLAKQYKSISTAKAAITRLKKGMVEAARESFDKWTIEELEKFKETYYFYYTGNQYRDASPTVREVEILPSIVCRGIHFKTYKEAYADGIKRLEYNLESRKKDVKSYEEKLRKFKKDKK